MKFKMYSFTNTGKQAAKMETIEILAVWKAEPFNLGVDLV